MSVNLVVYKCTHRPLQLMHLLKINCICIEVCILALGCCAESDEMGGQGSGGGRC